MAIVYRTRQYDRVRDRDGQLLRAQLRNARYVARRPFSTFNSSPYVLYIYIVLVLILFCAQQNCLEASLEVLEKTIQNMKETNENRSLIVLCNKTDLFTERLKHVAFSSEFSDYQGKSKCRFAWRICSRINWILQARTMSMKFKPTWLRESII